MPKLIINNVNVKQVGSDFELTLSGVPVTPSPLPPPPSPLPPPSQPPLTDQNLEFKGDFSKPEGTTLGEKQGDGKIFVTNGTLTWKGGVWTSRTPTFRLVTLNDTFTDVEVNIRARIIRFVDVQPKEAWDGMHAFIRYRSQYHLYYASFFRRDQTAALKKKCPGAETIDGDPHGTYYDYTSVKNPYTIGTWYDVKVIAKNDISDTMKLSLYVNGKLITSYSDNGAFGGKKDICTQIMRGGAIGIRSDNCEWEINDFVAKSRFPYP